LIKKIGLIGIGYIGTTIIQAIAEEKIEDTVVQAVYDIDKEKTEKIKEEWPSIRIMSSITDFHDCNIIIECAVQEVVTRIFDITVKNEKYFVPMSIGAFITFPDLYNKYQNLSEKQKSRIFLPSGAIGGFDCIDTVRLVGIKRAKIKTRKPNKAFRNNRFIESNNIKLSENSPVILFEGNAKLATTYFPRSVNVAARLALSTLGPEKTSVEIIADPTISKNIHTIEIESEVGKYNFTFENNPSPTNPKTSWLAALSAIYTIKIMKTETA
jgi:aspartate dehydrogenase